jgi:lipopolysaccharide transport system permease protein
MVSMRLLMFASPVIYPLSKVPDKYKWIIALNPMTSIIESFRYGWLGIGSFSWSGLLYSFVVMVIVLIAGIIIFNQAEKNAIDTV